MEKRKILSAALAALLLVGLFGCGTPSAETPTQTPGNQETQQPVATPPQDTLPTIGNVIKYDPNQPINDGKDIDIEFW